MAYRDRLGVSHSSRPRRESRVDKYGQNHRLICSCGISSGWKTEWWKAEKTLYQEHEDAARKSNLIVASVREFID